MKSTGAWLLILLFCISLLGGCSENGEHITSGSSDVLVTQSEPVSSSGWVQTHGDHFLPQWKGRNHRKSRRCRWCI